LSEELVEDFRDRFLIDVLEHVLDDVRVGSEDVGHEALLLPADEERDELAEVA